MERNESLTSTFWLYIMIILLLFLEFYIKLATLFLNKRILPLVSLFWAVLFHSLAAATPPPKDLGKDVCQGIWNAAGSNLKVPLELKVDLSGGTIPVFTPEPAGRTKIDSSQVFTTFKGNSLPYHGNRRKLSLK